MCIILSFLFPLRILMVMENCVLYEYFRGEMSQKSIAVFMSIIMGSKLITKILPILPNENA